MDPKAQRYIAKTNTRQTRLVEAGQKEQSVQDQLPPVQRRVEDHVPQQELPLVHPCRQPVPTRLLTVRNNHNGSGTIPTPAHGARACNDQTSRVNDKQRVNGDSAARG